MDCDFCVFTHKAHGVKWQLLESFFNSSWRAPAGAAKPAQAPSGGGGPTRCCRWALHGSNYTWLWYPDDDLIFGPGQLDKFVSAVTASRFHVLQASLCAGSEIHHPSLAQRPGVVNAIVPVHTVELQVRSGRPRPAATLGLRLEAASPPAARQMPMGRVSWWNSIRGPLLKGQIFGFGVDLARCRPACTVSGSPKILKTTTCRLLPAEAAAPAAGQVWTNGVGNEVRTGLVNSVCATHPFRKSKRHVSGLGDGAACSLTPHAPPEADPGSERPLQSTRSQLSFPLDRSGAGYSGAK